MACGLETRLGHGQIDEVLRHAFVGQDALNHGPVTAGTLKGVKQGVVPALGVGKKIDEGGHVVVHHQRQIGLGSGQIGARLGNQIGVHGEGHVAGHVGRGGLYLGDKSVALLERLHFEGVDLVDNVVELVRELRGAPDIDAA